MWAWLTGSMSPIIVFVKLQLLLMMSFSLLQKSNKGRKDRVSITSRYVSAIVRVDTLLQAYGTM